jgi:hypothetical protein
MWIPPASSSFRILSIPLSLLYIIIGILIFSWGVLGIGGYFGRGLYYECLKLREENSYLLQEAGELKELRSAMERIQRNEKVLRDYLGVDESEKKIVGLDQGASSPRHKSLVGPSYHAEI